MPTSDRYRVAAVAKLDKYPGKYLYVARGVSPKVIEHLQLTAQNVDEYQPSAQSARRAETRARPHVLR